MTRCWRGLATLALLCVWGSGVARFGRWAPKPHVLLASVGDDGVLYVWDAEEPKTILYYWEKLG